jgi:hypothetical protein
MTGSWRNSALVRLAGSAVSWFLFSLSFSLLYQSTVGVMQLGGSCASGGPYEIAVQCPDNVALFAPLSIFGGLIAVGIAIAFAQGFGTPLTTWAWPILFVGLGSAFMLAFIFGQDILGLLLGGMFIVMGLVPIVLELRGSPQRVFLGQFAVNGAQFFEGDRARRTMMSPNQPNPDGAIRPTLPHWVLALVIVATMSVLGYLTAVAWFSPPVAR